jgi:hypothetical protein
MSMYAGILSSVLNDWVDELSGEALIDFAQVCRVQMLDTSPHRDGAAIALAAELSYDRALIKVCETHGIEAVPLRFSRPGAERARLEGALASIGVDLVARSRSPGRD